MKRMMLMLFVLSMIGVASATSFLDKTSTDQLTYRALAPGQVAWNEEDGSAVMYIGSPSEDKNLRVIDPAALRGYRYKEIDDELTFNCDPRMQMLTNSTFRISNFDYSWPIDGYVYQEITGTNTVVTNVVTSGYSPNYQRYATYNPSTDTYTDVTLPVGFRFNVDNDTQYYRKKMYWDFNVTIISKYSNIQSVDYVYTHKESGGLGDFTTYDEQRTLTYDGRKATLCLRIMEGTSSGVWLQVTGFSAVCAGIGDDLGYVNNLTNTVFMIRDKIGTYNLNNLRHELYHKYDGNRGEDWSKYKAMNTLEMGTHQLLWVNTNMHVNASLGISGKSMMFAFGGSSYMQYIPATSDDLAGTEFEGLQITITDIMGAPTNRKTVSGDYDGNNDYSAYITSDNQIGIPFACSVPLPGEYIEVLYKSELQDPFWIPIEATLYDVSANSDSTKWLAVIPESYYVDHKLGFWKIGANVLAKKNRLNIKATVSVMGDDGKMYKLTFPSGGGAVTAVLDDGN